MMKLVRCIMLCLVVCSFCLSMASCHGTLRENAGPTDYSQALTDFVPPEDFDTSKNYELTFFAKSDSNAVQTNTYRRAISEFEALYPNIKIKLKVETDYSRLYQSIITNIGTDTPPNIAISYPDHVATYMTGKELVVPLDTLMTDERWGLGGSQVKFDAPKRSEMVEKFMQECVINGRHYAIPFVRSTEACYINKTMLERLGFTLPQVLTWDFIWQVSEAAMQKNPDGTYVANGQKVMLPFIYKSTDNMMIQILKQKGAQYSTDNGDILIFNDTTGGVLGEIGAHAASGAFSTFKIVSYPGNYLNRGQCIFAIDSTAGATWMGSHAPQIDVPASELVNFEMAVMEIPQYDVANPTMISQGPSICIFNKADKNEVLASWLFVQYLLTNDIQMSYATTEGYVPVTTKAQQSAEYQNYLSRSGEDNEMHYDVKIAATELLLRNIDNTFITPVFNGSANLRNAAGQMIEDVCRAVRRKETIDGEFISKLYDKMRSLYKLK